MCVESMLREAHISSIETGLRRTGEDSWKLLRRVEAPPRDRMPRAAKLPGARNLLCGARSVDKMQLFDVDALHAREKEVKGTLGLRRSILSQTLHCLPASFESKRDHSTMTRSRDSELQRRYAQMEGLPFPPTAEALQKLVVQSSLEVNPTVATLGAFARNNGSPPQTSASPPMPPTTVAHTQLLQPPMESQSNNHISAAISMLKGSLERKKLSSKQQQHAHHLLPISQGGTRPDASLHMASLPVDPTVAKQQRHNESGHSPPLGQQPNMMLNAHSPSESSGGAPAHSAGMTTSDGPSNSGMSAHRQALKRGNLSSVDQPSPRRHHSGFDVPSPSSNAQSNGDMYESGTVSKTETRKKGGEHLTRAGSITSSIRSGFQVSDIDEATKKRRVERQRKMQEAKGRGSAPPMPADVQAAVKRCEALEKEVRSLKLNLAFMNRKDSEQTKRIEELEKQNEELHEEKDKLLEELERFSTMNDPGGSTP